MEKFYKFMNQKGQTLVLYALLIPLLFVVSGAGVELGWYYMNVSRLQNAADAAVIAGAQELVKSLYSSNDTSNTSEYIYYSLVDKVSDGFIQKDRDTTTGDDEAKYYIKRNLSPKDYEWNGNIISDSWTKRDIRFDHKFYQPPDNSIDEDNEKKFYAYYEVILTEKPNHFFNIFNSFGDMNIQVKAVAELSTVRKSNGTMDKAPTLIEQMDELKDTKIYANFEQIQNEYSISRSKDIAKREEEIQELVDGGMTREEAQKKVNEEWIEKLTAKYISMGIAANTAKSMAKTEVEGDRSFTQAQERTIQSQGNWWLKDFTTYRTENLTMRGLGGPNWNIDQYSIDDLFVDFKADFTYSGNEDWDITENKMLSKMSWYDQYNKIFDSKTDPEKIRYYYRIYALLGVESARNGSTVLNKFPYKVRPEKFGADPLYIRIESEQMKLNKYNEANHKVRNSVHQIIININVSNYKDDKESLQEDRPLIFFYDGPDKISESSTVRNSRPVILNLHADFRGILYAPNSPVIIAGNGHKFRGFVVAKEFVKLKTEKDFIDSGYTKVVRRKMDPVQNGSVNNQPITDYNSYFDRNKIYIENNIFVKPEDIISAENLPTNNPEELVKNYIQVTYSEGNSGAYYIRKDCDYFEEIETERANAGEAFNKIKVPKIIIEHKHGDIEIAGKILASKDYDEKAVENDVADKIFKASDFGLSSSEYNSFLLLKFANYKYLNKTNGADNMFESDRAEHID